MNGSDSDWERCHGAYCNVEQGHAEDSCYDHIRFTGKHYQGRWYCDVCWAVLQGENRIAELEADNEALKKRVVWFEKMMKPSLLARLLRRISMRRSYAERMEEGLKTILSHAGSAIECVDEPGKTYLREICEIVDEVYGEDTSEECLDG